MDDLSDLEEAELLKYVAVILLHPGSISERDYQELDTINQELIRREELCK